LTNVAPPFAVPPVQLSPDLATSTLPDFQYTLTNGYNVSFEFLAQLNPVPWYLSSVVLSDEHPNQKTHFEVFCHAVNALYINDFSKLMQWPHASPFDHTAINGTSLLSANFFTALNPELHLFNVGVETRDLRNVVVVLAMLFSYLMI